MLPKVYRRQVCVCVCCSTHLSEVVFKVAELQTLLQLGLVCPPELITRPLGLIQLGQQSDRGEERGIEDRE